MKVVVIPVRDEINSPTLYVLRRGLKEAINQHVDVVVIDMNTPGGNGGTALEMMEALNRFPGTTITFVNHDAFSAGALIAAATTEIWFEPTGVIGAAAPVTAEGQDIPETMRMKVTSAMEAKVRAVCTGRGWRGDVISAMMDKDFELNVDGKVLKKAGQGLLSLTANEAVARYGNPPRRLLGAGVARDLDDLLTQKYGKNQYTVTELRVTWSEKLAQYLTGLAPVLLGLGLLALFIEFKMPTHGHFGLIGVVLLIVVFLSSYVAGLSGHEPLLAFLLGLVLLAAEVFFFPGVMLLALSGIVLMLGSLVWALADLWPHEPLLASGHAFVGPLGEVGLGLAIAVAGAAILARFLPKSWFWNRMVLSTAVDGAAQIGGIAPDAEVVTDSLIGRTALVTTPLRPFGQVLIDGRHYEARLDFGFADVGASVVVVRRAEFGLAVEKEEA